MSEFINRMLTLIERMSNSSEREKFTMEAYKGEDGRLFPNSEMAENVYPVALRSDHPFLQELIDSKLCLCLAMREWTILYKKTWMLFILYDKHVYIEYIATLPEERNKGNASDLMKKFIAAADKTGMIIELCTDEVPHYAFTIAHPATDVGVEKEGKIPTDKLTEWFERFGFVKTTPYQYLGYYMERNPISINK